MNTNEHTLTTTHTHAPKDSRPKAYAFKHWGRDFENAQTRKQRKLSQVLMPQSIGTDEHNALLSEQHGIAMYSIWTLLAQIAAQCPQRGLLADKNGPLSLKTLSVLTRISEEFIELTLNTLCDPKIDYLEQVDCPKHLIASGSMRKGRSGKPAQPELIDVRGLPQDAPDFHVEWIRTMAKQEKDGQVELICKLELPPEVDAIVNPKPPAPPKKSKTLVLLEEALRRIETLEQTVVDHTQPKQQTINHQQDKPCAHCGLPQQAPSKAKPNDPPPKRGLPPSKPPQKDPPPSDSIEDPADLLYNTWNAERGLRPARPLRNKDRHRIAEVLALGPDVLKKCLEAIEDYGKRARSGHATPNFRSFLHKRFQAIKREVKQDLKSARQQPLDRRENIHGFSQ